MQGLDAGGDSSGFPCQRFSLEQLRVLIRWIFSRLFYNLLW